MNLSCMYDAGLNSYELRVSGQLVPSEAERMDHPQRSPGKEGHPHSFGQLEAGKDLDCCLAIECLILSSTDDYWSCVGTSMPSSPD